jgi:hypothetical protein
MKMFMFAHVIALALLMVFAQGTRFDDLSVGRKCTCKGGCNHCQTCGGTGQDKKGGTSFMCLPCKGKGYK